MWSNYFNAPATAVMCCRCPYFAFCSMKNNDVNARPKDKKKVEKDVDFFYRQKEFTIEELAQYDGSGGKPAYVAVGGIVYDVSLNPAWGGGTHFGLTAGKDLTVQFTNCHDADSKLAVLPKVGVLK